MTETWSDCLCNWLEDGLPDCAGCEEQLRLYRTSAVHWAGKHWHERCLLTHLLEQLNRAA